MLLPMAKRLYKRAPIIEAVIDLNLKWKEPPKSDVLGACRTKLAETFPTQNPIHTVHMGMARHPEDEKFRFTSGQKEVGLRLTSKENDRVLQITHQTFTYSHLAPYTRWELFRDEARSVWSTFVETCAPEAVTRIAVRYINRIVIPEPVFELFNYFNLYPHLPEGVPQDVSGYLLQLQMPQTDIGSLAVINMAMDISKAPTEIAILLDLDVFSSADEQPRNETIWFRLEQLRDRKDLLFEACITDKTRSLIE